MNAIFKNCKHYDEEHDCCRLASDYDNEPCYQPCTEGPCDYEPKNKEPLEE